ncbi:hypothetical protein BH23THE1_BH23THE1_26850 [soil metagenome]
MGLPKERKYAEDRAPTVEEIQKLLEYPDRRIKSILLTMLSSGIRLAAWDDLKIKHIKPIKDEEGVIGAAKIIVYAGSDEQNYSFITPEAYSALNEWIEFRRVSGERITEEGWRCEIYGTLHLPLEDHEDLQQYQRNCIIVGLKV